VLLDDDEHVPELRAAAGWWRGDGDGGRSALALTRGGDRRTARRDRGHETGAADRRHRAVGRRPDDGPPGERIAPGVLGRRGELRGRADRHGWRTWRDGDARDRSGRGWRAGAAFRQVVLGGPTVGALIEVHVPAHHLVAVRVEDRATDDGAEIPDHL